MQASSFLPAMLMMFGTLVGAAALEYQPGDPHEVAAVFPPWWSHATVIAAAASAGLIQSTGATRNVVLLRSPVADLAQRARNAGALFVLAGSGFGLCGGYESASRPAEKVNAL